MQDKSEKIAFCGVTAQNYLKALPRLDIIQNNGEKEISRQYTLQQHRKESIS